MFYFSLSSTHNNAVLEYIDNITQQEIKDRLPSLDAPVAASALAPIIVQEWTHLLADESLLAQEWPCPHTPMVIVAAFHLHYVKCRQTLMAYGACILQISVWLLSITLD